MESKPIIRNFFLFFFILLFLIASTLASSLYIYTQAFGKIQITNETSEFSVQFSSVLKRIQLYWKFYRWGGFSKNGVAEWSGSQYTSVTINKLEIVFTNIPQPRSPYLDKVYNTTISSYSFRTEGTNGVLMVHVDPKYFQSLDGETQTRYLNAKLINGMFDITHVTDPKRKEKYSNESQLFDAGPLDQVSFVVFGEI